MHKYVASYMSTIILLLSRSFHVELVNFRGHKLAEVDGYLTCLRHIGSFGFLLLQHHSSKLKSSNYAGYCHIDMDVALK